MATLKEVAQRAGVSVATVSCALNNSPKVTAKTKEKILQVAKELNYTPNKSARNLKKRKTETIGLFLRDFGGPFYNDLIQGVQKITMENGYDLIVCSTYGGTDSTGYSFLRDNGVDGAIILASNLEDTDILNITRDGFPIVLLDRVLEGNCIYNILIDNKAGAYEATKHLIEEKRLRLGCIVGPENSYDSQLRFEGFKDALGENNCIISNNLIAQGDFTEKSGYDCMKKILKNDRPDAVFCLNDEMAIGALTYLKEQKLRVPEDIAIIGFDDIKLASYIQPALSTVGHPKFEWGEEAAECLFNALNKPDQAKNKLLPTQLVVRESSVNS